MSTFHQFVIEIINKESLLGALQQCKVVSQIILDLGFFSLEFSASMEDKLQITVELLYNNYCCIFYSNMVIKLCCSQIFHNTSGPSCSKGG